MKPNIVCLPLFFFFLQSISFSQFCQFDYDEDKFFNQTKKEIAAEDCYCKLPAERQAELCAIRKAVNSPGAPLTMWKESAINMSDSCQVEKRSGFLIPTTYSCKGECIYLVELIDHKTSLIFPNPLTGGDCFAEIPFIFHPYVHRENRREVTAPEFETLKKTNNVDLELFPNPISKGVNTNMFWDNEIIFSELSIYNLVGKEEMQISTNLKKGWNVIPTSSLNKGTYIVIAKSNSEKHIIKKLIIR